MTWPETVLGQLRKYLVIQGPAPIKKYTFPRNSRGRCFFKHYCQRLLPNIDNVIRPWIIYSESADKTCCFYCKLHTQESTSSLAHGGFYDLANVFRRLKEHEKSKHHVNATA